MRHGHHKYVKLLDVRHAGTLLNTHPPQLTLSNLHVACIRVRDGIRLDASIVQFQ